MGIGGGRFETKGSSGAEATVGGGTGSECSGGWTSDAVTTRGAEALLAVALAVGAALDGTMSGRGGSAGGSVMFARFKVVVAIGAVPGAAGAAVVWVAAPITAGARGS
jgi:hypothetical protein